MNARATALTLLLALTPTIVPATALAQAPADEATTKTARARFQEGVTAFDKGQYDVARVAFLQAYALKHHPAVLLNLGQCSLKLQRWQEASRYFTQYQHDARDAAPANKEAAAQGLAEARTHLGRVEVNAPAGTEVYVDDERMGAAPLEPIDVAPGAHNVKLRGEGGKEESYAVIARAGEHAAVHMSAPAPATPAAAAPPPSAPEPAPEVATAPLPTQEPQAAPASTDSSPGPFSPPESMAPVYVASGVAVAGLVVGIVFGIQRNTAQSNADKVEQQIRAAGGGTGTCSSQDPSVQASFGEACAVLADNRNIVNTNATVANIAFVTSGVAAVTAIGWYFLAPKAGAAT